MHRKRQSTNLILNIYITILLFPLVVFMDANVALWALVGYVVGSLPWGYWIGKLKGIDITKKGSGNIGAANVNRVLGAKYAVLVAILDFLKGFLPPYMAYVLTSDPRLSLVAALFAGVGAAFSVFMRFHGGKGFAALAGAFIALAYITNSFGTVAVLATTWISIVVLTRIASLTNFVTMITAIPLTALTGNAYLFSFAIFATLLLSYTLRENIKRLLEGTERKITDRVK